MGLLTNGLKKKKNGSQGQSEGNNSKETKGAYEKNEHNLPMMTQFPGSVLQCKMSYQANLRT
jgi:hypothetical protein